MKNIQQLQVGGRNLMFTLWQQGNMAALWVCCVLLELFRGPVFYYYCQHSPDSEAEEQQRFYFLFHSSAIKMFLDMFSSRYLESPGGCQGNSVLGASGTSGSRCTT